MDILSDVIICFLLFVSTAYGKHCAYIYDSGIIKHFTCNIYEYCCGPMCCRSQAVTFYQVWYFWLIVFLTLLLCSGGSWWYRFHHREPFINPAMGSPVAPVTRPIVRPAGFAYAPAPPPQAFYPRQPPVQQATTQQSCAPPPPYYEPPPSYEAATTKTGS